MGLDNAYSITSATQAARTQLASLARGSSVDEPRVAKIAHAAIFEEALLAALHSRLSELRTVAK